MKTENEPIDHPEDCQRIIDACKANDIDLTPNLAQDIWTAYSTDKHAGWLNMEDMNAEEIWNCLIPYLAVPCIHLNGSGKENLLEQCKDVYSSCMALESAIMNSSPHMRDYYPLPKGIFELAQKRHLIRLQKVKDIMSEIQDLGWKILNQGKE